jgi:signal transduction histidine kinase
MTLSLRTRFFLLLMGFMLFCFVLNFSADLAHDYLAALMKERHWLQHEMGEFLGILAANLLVMPFVLGLGWWLARRMTAPVAEAAEIADRIAAGELTERVPMRRGPPEIIRLTRALNQAFDRYEEDLRRMRRFAAHAAHQLRTPLAALRAEVEVTLARPRDEATYRESLQVVLERLRNWSQSVEQMLMLAELETDQWSDRFVRLDLGALIHRVVSALEVLATEKGIILLAPPASPAYALGDEVLLEQLFTNLIDNAIRYTPAGGRLAVTVQTGAKPGRVYIAIADTGPGMPEEHRRHIQARSHGGLRATAPATGFGLAIAAEIARLHGAPLDVSDNTPSGTIITFSLSSADASSADPFLSKT